MSGNIARVFCSKLLGNYMHPNKFTRYNPAQFSPVFRTSSPVIKRVYEPMPRMETTSYSYRPFSTQKTIEPNERTDAVSFQKKHIYRNHSAKQNVAYIISLIKDGVNTNEITIPKGLDKKSITEILTSIGELNPILPACGATNPQGIFSPVKIFHNPNLPALKEIESELNNKVPKIWGYQMQKVPLHNKDDIEIIANHIFNVHNKSTVVLKINPKADFLFKPKVDPVTLKSNSEDRVVSFDSFWSKVGRGV